jgi:hypothetical protein
MSLIRDFREAMVNARKIIETKKEITILRREN